LWFEGFDPETAAGVSVATGERPAVALAKGPHRLTLIAQDASGALDLDDVAIDVVDRTPPQPSCVGETKECTGPLTDVVTSCSASDVCDSAPVASSDAEDAYPVGSHEFACSATDIDGNTASTSCAVIVQDTTPPVIEVSGDGQLFACHGDPQVFTVPFPVVTDLCGASAVIGELVAVGDRALETPVAVPEDGQLLLPAAPFIIRWTSMDEHGNQTSLEQAFGVQVAISASCCGAGQTLIEGTPGHDNIHPSQAGNYCVLAFGDKDVVSTGDGNDHLFGGEGDDALQCGGGSDLVVGGFGSDQIRGKQSGSLVAHGGQDNDVLHAGSSSTSLLWAGLGDDNVDGSPGQDTIYPGPGRDVVNAQAGNDTVILFDACEVVSGKVLHGGAGTDTLVTPLSPAGLLARGVNVHGFEVIVVDRSKAYLSECF
jgi:hypothetical protein